MIKEIEINEKQVVKKAKMKKERNKITMLSKQYSTVNKMKKKIESYEINSRRSKSRGAGKDIKRKDKIRDCIAKKRKNKRKKQREENRREKMLKTSNGFDLVTAGDTEK